MIPLLAVGVEVSVGMGVGSCGWVGVLINGDLVGVDTGLQEEMKRIAVETSKR